MSVLAFSPAPDKLTEKAHERLRQGSEQRKHVLSAVNRGNVLAAEPEPERAIRRLQAVTGVTEKAAKEMLQGASAADFGLGGEVLLGAERIQGKTTDFVGTSFLDLARAAAASVGRVVFRNDLAPQGTGFMVTPTLFLTNNHVIANAADSRRFVVQFNYEIDIFGQPKQIIAFEPDPDTFFCTSPVEELDFTLVALGKRIAGNGTLAEFGYCPLLDTDDKHMLGEFVNIIQHPGGDFKQVVIRENRLVTRLDTVLHYEADTVPGSSGSPVFNDQFEAVALHHWGEPYTETTTPDGRPVSKAVNEGVRVSAIVKAVSALANQLSRSQRALLSELLAPRFRQPSIAVQAHESQPIPRPDPRPELVASKPKITELAAADTATLTIPLKINFSVGAAGAAVAPARVPVEPELIAAEKVVIDQNYNARDGYKPAFLQGFTIPLPKLNPALKAKAARRIDGSPGDPTEVKYWHFSIVVNGSPNRRMAYFTGVNIDGATWKKIDRKTGEPASEAAEASEKWYQDPRLHLDAQAEQALYSNQGPPRIFDRGHLVRREDPNWGTPTRAQKANADTFHFTNCSTQEWRFNEQAQFWAGLENYVLDNAKAEREKVSVFTGPVFADDDPDYRSIKVPRQFWKILVRVDSDTGKLRSTALLADQSELLKSHDLSEGGEAFDPMPKRVRERQTSITNIEALTGLDFGNAVREADSFSGGEALEAGAEAVLLERWEHLRL